MKSIAKINESLSITPDILIELLDEIPSDLLNQRRIKNKWSIHEHACHIAVGDKFGFHKRIVSFKNELQPKFEPLSGESFDKNFFYEMNLNKALNEFKELRRKTIELTNRLESQIWNKNAIHPEYNKYTPYIMLRHLLMHDYFHLYRIEELWLTEDKYLK